MLASVAAPAAAATTPPLGAQSGTFAYVTNGGSDRLAEINTADNTITGTFAVSNVAHADPNGVAASPDGTRVYVANALADTMSVVFPADDSFLSIGVGENPTAVALSPDGNRAYVTNEDDGTLSVINTVDVPEEVTVVGVGTNPQEVALAAGGAKAYVAIQPEFDVGAVAVVDTTANPPSVSTIPVGAFPQGVAVSPDGTRVYVANFADGTVSVINTATDAVVDTINVGGGTTSPVDVAVSPDGRRAYTANFGSGNVSVIDLTITPPVVIANVASGEQPKGVAVTRDSSRVYVTSSENNSVSAIDTVTNRVTVIIDGFSIPLGVAIGTRTIGATPADLTLKAQSTGQDKDAPGTLRNPGAVLKARLTSGGRPLADREVLFAAGSQVLCIERTDSRGGATCAVPGGKSAPDCYRATFLGGPAHAATTASTCSGHGRGRS